MQVPLKSKMQVPLKSASDTPPVNSHSKAKLTGRQKHKSMDPDQDITDDMWGPNPIDESSSSSSNSNPTIKTETPQNPSLYEQLNQSVVPADMRATVVEHTDQQADAEDHGKQGLGIPTNTIDPTAAEQRAVATTFTPKDSMPYAQHQVNQASSGEGPPPLERVMRSDDDDDVDNVDDEADVNDDEEDVDDAINVDDDDDDDADDRDKVDQWARRVGLGRGEKRVRSRGS
jgi:hypothetical protein